MWSQFAIKPISSRLYQFTRYRQWPSACSKIVRPCEAVLCHCSAANVADETRVVWRSINSVALAGYRLWDNDKHTLPFDTAEKQDEALMHILLRSDLWAILRDDNFIYILGWLRFFGISDSYHYVYMYLAASCHRRRQYNTLGKKWTT